MEIHFTRRQKTILHELYHTADYLTSLQLAQITHVSDRTIKTEMRTMMDIAGEDGSFHIISKRNHGYLLAIDDPTRFDALIAQVELGQTYALDLENENIIRFMTIARKLIIASEPIKVDQFADTLYISLSQVHKTLEQVRAFFSLHHLLIIPKSNKGLIVEGTEYDRRMVILELYGVHFHKVEVHAESEYLNWVGPDEDRRHDIRHVFLKVLRGSTIRLLDGDTQRLSIYLNIVDRRYPKYGLTIPDNWKTILAHSPELELSNRIFATLKQEINAFDYDDAEVIYFAVELLTREDIDALAYTPYFHPAIHVVVSKLSSEVLNALYHQLHINLLAHEWCRREFEAITTPIVARKVLGGIYHEHLPFADKNEEISNSPVSMAVAMLITHLVQKNLGMTLERAEIIKYAFFVYKVCAYTKFQVKPINLILISGNGINTARLLEKRIRDRFNNLIGRTKCIELYEGRGIDMHDYDAVLMDMDSFLYNYDLPCKVVHLVKRSHQLDELYNELIITSHQYQWYIPLDEQLTVLNEYPVESTDTFIKNLAYRYYNDLIKVEQITQIWKAYIDLMDLNKSSKGIVLFLDSNGFDKEWYELLRLSNDLSIDNAKIKYVFVVCIQWNYDEIKMKFWENILKQSTLRSDFFDLIQLGSNGFERMIKEALWIN